MLQKTFSAQVKQETGRRLRFVASTEAIDRDGDILSIDGWQVENYLRNPVILLNHSKNPDDLPIARTISLIKNSILRRLEIIVEFPKPGIYPMADTVYSLASNGFINAVSVGFLGYERVPIEGGGWRYTKQELLEISIVNIPANQEALQLAVSRGVITKSQKMLLEKKPFSWRDVDKEIDLDSIPSSSDEINLDEIDASDLLLGMKATAAIERSLRKKDSFVEIDDHGVQTILRDQDLGRFIGKMVAQELKRIRKSMGG